VGRKFLLYDLPTTRLLTKAFCRRRRRLLIKFEIWARGRKEASRAN
jgi:hypothetical protein